MLRFAIGLCLCLGLVMLLSPSLRAGGALGYEDIDRHAPVDAIPFDGSNAVLGVDYQQQQGQQDPQQGQFQQQDQQQQGQDQGTPAVDWGVVDVFSRLNVRTGPGVEYRIVGKLNPGERVAILELDMGWYRIAYQGRRDVWVCGYYLRKEGERFRNPSAAAQADWSEGRDDPRIDWAPDRDSSLGPGRYVPSVAVGDEGTPGRYEPLRPDRKEVEVPAARRVRGGSVLKVPLIGQMRSGGKYPSGYCGPTAVKMVMQYYGKNPDIDHIALSRIAGTPMYKKGEGSNSDVMVKVFRKMGFPNTYKVPNRSIDWLRQQTQAGRPVIVGVKGQYHPSRGSNFGHFVVVVGVTDSGDVVINDPGNGKRMVCPARMFNTAWSKRWRYGIVPC